LKAAADSAARQNLDETEAKVLMVVRRRKADVVWLKSEENQEESKPTQSIQL
jgi:hypothetical protein